MRVALLSAMKTMHGDMASLRGLARIGGRSVLQRQLDFALSARCERIACLCSDLSTDMIELQHAAEKGGAKFQIIRDIRPLSGIVSASDEILVLADGLAFEPSIAQPILATGKGVVVLPAEEAVSLGFERLDRDRAWSGIMLAGGRLVEQLADLPPDVDPQSSLLRIALQNGVRGIDLSPKILADGQWCMIDRPESAVAFESRWLSAAVTPASFLSPVRAAADRLALLLLRRFSPQQSAGRATELLASGLLGLAGAGAFFGYPIAGLAVLALAVFASRVGQVVSSVDRKIAGASRLRDLWAIVQPLLVDFALIALVLTDLSTRPRIAAGFAAFMAIGLIRLAEAPGTSISFGKSLDLLTDRAILALIMLIAVASSNIIPVLQGFGLILLLVLLVRSYWPKLTRA